MMTEVRVRPGVADGPCDVPAVDRARCFRSDVTDVSLAIGGLDDQVGAVEAPQVVRGDALRVDGIREVREVHRGKRLPVSQAEVMGDQRGFVSGGLAREVIVDDPEALDGFLETGQQAVLRIVAVRIHVLERVVTGGLLPGDALLVRRVPGDRWPPIGYLRRLVANQLLVEKAGVGVDAQCPPRIVLRLELQLRRPEFPEPGVR